jgi:hypothetical protein
MLQSRFICVLLLIGAAIPSAARTKMPPVLAACSAFAPDGSSAMATIIGDTLELTAADLSGHNSKLTLPLKYPAQQSQLNNPASRWRVYDCSLFFNTTSSLIALGIRTESEPPQRLQVAVADFRTAKWLSDFRVEPRKEVGESANLAGFLGDTDSVVVIRNWNSSVGESIAVLLFNAGGEQLPNHTPVRVLSETSLPFYADPRNNRLWVFHCTVISARASQQPFCPIDESNLSGEQALSAKFDPSHSGLKRTGLWELPHTFAAPDQNTVLIAGSDTVWKVEMDTQQLTRFALPHDHFLKWNFEQNGTISPDGAVFGFLFGQYRLAFPYMVDNYVSEGDDIVVLHVNPLRLLRVVRRNGVKYTRGLSIDHRNGKTTVLAYRQDHWERQDFPDVKP